jgi:small-conductance mechanosensitive channel
MSKEFDFAWFHTGNLFGISYTNLAIAMVAGLGVYIVMSFAVRFAFTRLAKIAGQTDNRFDDVIVEVLGNTNQFLIALVALLIGLGVLDLPERWMSRVGQLWFVALALQMALWINGVITVGLRRHGELNATASSTSASVSAAATLVSWGLRVVLWAVVLLAMLSNIGVNITAFVASLGVGGIAIALAAQNILGDLFASVAIAVDKPFEVGDFVVMGEVVGSVEEVGIKTTRIRSLSGEQIVMANTEMLKQTIRNYKRLMERRIVFGFGVTYSSTPEQMQAIPEIVKKVVEGSERLRFDRAHFKAFGDSSLDFEVVYIVLDPDYNVYMDEQQRINLALLRELTALGVDFAFPTRTLHMVPTEAP